MAKLPDVPEGLELEDYVAALFQSTQHYVEKNVCEPDVLELDVVATSFATGQSDTHVIEVKGGGWGFGDLFKTLGRMHYLSIPKGLFITTGQPEKMPASFYAAKVAKDGLRVLQIEDIKQAAQVFESAGFGKVDEMTHWLWRHSFWTERQTIAALRAEARSRSDATGPKEVLRYFRLVNNEVCLTADPRERAVLLYEAFAEHPLLTLGVARELDGEEFDAETPGQSQALRQAIYEGLHPVIHASMYVEHRARLALLKSVIDCLLLGIEFSGSGAVVSALPATFRAAARELKTRPRFSRYPLFWQVLLWGWGGLILEDHREAEEQALAAQAGLKIAHLESALGAFDVLFPTDSGWIRRMDTANYRFVSMVPWPFMGIGAFHRLLIHNTYDFRTMNLNGDFTVRDLARRYVALAKHLEPPTAAGSAS